MKFELLPNEILVECFDYLDGVDIFYSFDQLNDRFNKLIRIIPLQISFEHVRKTTFSQFCQKISSNSGIIQKISSLNLSNKNTCGQIKLFLSMFSLNQYANLRSLTLINVEEENIFLLKSILPLCLTLHTFHLISPQINEDEIISSLPMSNLRKLSLTSLRYFLIYNQQPTIITHLTIFNCSLEQILYQLFWFVPMLKYLNIEYISKYNRSIKKDRYNAIHLKQLIIGNFKYLFEDFVNFVQQTPNLDNLTINVDRNISMFDADEWEMLITTSLPYLNLFRFIFSCDRKNNDLVILCFEQFQTDFWIQQHQWYTQMLFNNSLVYIHTIPYLSNTFNLEFNSKILGDSLNTFDNVNYLTICHEQITDECLYRFPNVISLKIVISEQEISDYSISKCLKMIINLSNINHLDISTYSRLIRSGELLLILKESTQLSSLVIHPKDLTLLYFDNQLCQYLNKMIKKLNIFQHDHSAFDNLDHINMFCTIFSNVEQLTCSINQPESIRFLLCGLSHLTTMYVYLSPIHDRNYLCYFMEKLAHTAKIMFSLKDLSTNAAGLSIWIDEKLQLDSF